VEYQRGDRVERVTAEAEVIVCGGTVNSLQLDTLFLAAPVASKGRLLQYAGRILRPYDGKTTAEVHDYHDEQVGVLASSLAKRAPGYTSLGFPDPRRLPYSPSAAATPSAVLASPV
jgi:hypothetical protein